MEKKIFLNRYSDRILFERIDLLKFRMSGFMKNSIRVSRMIDANGNIHSVDPSGGPRICSKSANPDGFTKMSEFNSKWKYLDVDDINFEEFSDDIILTCTYDREIKWKQIKNPA